MSDDDHYIEVTATIGPIEPPYLLHTFGDGAAAVHTTVHGDHVQRLFEAINEADHNAGCSARIISQAELDETELRLADAEAERDRLRAALEMIAIPPVHVPDISEGCEGCAGVARAALDGTDYRGRISTILADEMAGVRVVEAAKRWYRAVDVEELTVAVAGLQAAVKEVVDAEEET